MSLTSRVFTSAYLQLLLNVILKLIGIFSTLILARMLTPTDFGVIAVMAITVHLTDILSDAGSQQYIIQKLQVNSHDLNTAWTIDVISKSALAVIIFLCAPSIAHWLENPLLTDPIRIIILSSEYTHIQHFMLLGSELLDLLKIAATV